jgi:hypothetical protein
MCGRLFTVAQAKQRFFVTVKINVGNPQVFKAGQHHVIAGKS